MKILLVIPYFYPKIGGLENYALRIARGLQTNGHDVVVVTTSHLRKEYQRETLFGIQIYRLPISFTLSNTPISFAWFLDIDDIIKKEQPDVINAHTPVPFIADIASILAKKRKIPFVLTYQNDLEKDPFFLRVIIWLYYFFLGIPTLRKTHTIIATSSYYAHGSVYLKRFLSKIQIVPPGVDIERFSLPDLPSRVFIDLQQKYAHHKVILFIGQLDKTHVHKGLSSLIASMKEISTRNSHARLVIVGKGDYVDYYRHLVTTFGLDDVVEFVGFVSDDELPYYYTISTVVVLPSHNRSEGFGMVLIEAGGCKKPVVASEVGGIPSVVKHTKTGLLTKPKDIHGLADAILTILGDERLAYEMGLRNYAWVKENFTWEQQIERTEQLFQRIVTIP